MSNRLTPAGWALWIVASQGACGISLDTLSDANIDASFDLPPLANAGPDREVLRGYPALLSARGSYHPSGNLTYRWEQLAGEVVHLSNPNDPQPTFLAPLTEQTLLFRVWVSDGRVHTHDDVALLVHTEPQKAPPRLRMAADRRRGTRFSPDDADVASVVPEDAAVTCAEVFPTPVTRFGENVGVSSYVSVFRCDATDGALRSAPDHVLLWDDQTLAAGARAPIAQASAPQVVAPNQQLILDAHASSDPNGDLLKWHWEQVSGTPLQLGPMAGATATFLSPSFPGELTFRVHVRDPQLGSAPTDLTVLVTSTHVPIAVAPSVDQVAHAGRTVWLDALARAPLASVQEGTTFEWQQTYGPEATLQPSSNGRAISVLIPQVEPTTLAFAVSSRLGDAASTPSVTQVQIVEDTDNQSPSVYFCPDEAASTDNTYVFVLFAVDPDSDPIASFDLSLDNDEDADVSSEPTTTFPASTSTCSYPGAVPPAAAEHTLHVRVTTTVLNPPLTAPRALTALVCDSLGACNSQSVELE